jgi:hypothetical protein
VFAVGIAEGGAGAKRLQLFGPAGRALLSTRLTSVAKSPTLSSKWPGGRCRKCRLMLEKGQQQPLGEERLQPVAHPREPQSNGDPGAWGLQIKGFRNGAALFKANQTIGRTPAGRKKAAMEVGLRKEGSCILPLWLRRIGKVKMPLLNGDDTSFWLALDKGLEQGSRTELEIEWFTIELWADPSLYTWEREDTELKSRRAIEGVKLDKIEGGYRLAEGERGRVMAIVWKFVTFAHEIPEFLRAT